MLPKGGDPMESPKRSTIRAQRRRGVWRSRKPRQTAQADRADRQRFRIVHPFHPLQCREFELLVHQRYASEERVRFLDDDNQFREIPLSWTNAAPEDPWLVIARERSWFRFDDLLELVRIVEDLSGPCVK
jgi:uncharacterized protein DUF5372